MNNARTLIKICGITTLEQAVQIAELGVDAIGIISVKDSPRYVPPNIKNRIFRTLKKLYPDIKRVSVVKNLSSEIISDDFLNDENVIQLHGDEDLNYCKNVKRCLPEIELWKAFRIKSREDILEIQSFYNFIDVVLLDSWNKDTYGGSGVRINQKFLEDLKFDKQWWLARGISIDWAKKIINDIRPNGIDISSSIEISPGIKDIEKTKALLKEINT